MNLEEGSFLDSASRPQSEESSTTLVPLPIRQRLSGDLVTAGEVNIDVVGVTSMESLVVLSSMLLPSIFRLFCLLKPESYIEQVPHTYMHYNQNFASTMGNRS